jgi:uncharacterized protein (TIGR00255 family)
MSARSMTGFARVRRTLPEGELILSLKSVNHRGLDMHFHLPEEFDPFEAGIRAAIKKHVARGHMQIHLQYTRTAGMGDSNLNRPMLQAWLNAFHEAARENSLPDNPDLNAAFRIPGMFQGENSPELDPAMEQTLFELAEEAVKVLDKFREREGGAIAAEMLERCRSIVDLVSRMEKIRSKATVAFQKRLKERLAELLRGAALDPQRLAQEAALLADRSDISEELVRLRTHAGQLEKLLTSTGEIGKRLDFLLQEMNRESNTILSKTGGLGDLGLTITDLALAAKSEIDKIREQSLNLE